MAREMAVAPRPTYMSLNVLCRISLKMSIPEFSVPRGCAQFTNGGRFAQPLRMQA